MATERRQATRPLYTLLRFHIWTIFVAFLALPAMASEYRLDVGDVLELTIAGIPEMRHRIPIGLNGEASFPLIGEIQAVGLTLPELRRAVDELLPRQVYKNRNISGVDANQIIEAHEISLYVANYRPVYLTGDVARPGEITYRPGLTVRQAVSVAGGYDVLRSETGSSLVEVLDLRSEYDTLSIELAREIARVWRLETMLGRTDEVAHDGLPAIEPDILSGIIGLEEKQLEAQQDAYESEKDFLVSAIEHADQRIETLSARLKNEEEGAELDADEMERVNELYRRGVVPITRVTEIRRAALLASSRALETSVAAEDARKDLEELKSELQLLDESRRVELLQELNNVNANLEILRKKLQGSREKMLVAGAARTDLGRDGNVQILVFRKEADERVRLAAHEDMELLPGDVVEVTLQIGLANEMDAMRQSSIR